MARREKLYEQPLKAPLSDESKGKLSEIVKQRLGSAVSKQAWHPTHPVLTVEATMVRLIITANEPVLVVEAEYGLAASFLINDARRQQARDLARLICQEAGL